MSNQNKVSFKPIIGFIIRFFIFYFALLFIYQWYLSPFQEVSKPDGFTVWVAENIAFGFDLFGKNCYAEPMLDETSVLLNLDHFPVVRVIEGCNAISLMILFTAFVLAFRGKILFTTLYIFFGYLIIHLINVGRIMFLSYLYRYFPESGYGSFFHDYFFPLIIYGTVLLLIIFWVNLVLKQKYPTYKKSK